MNRIFQHWQGEVSGFQGQRITSLFSVNEGDNVVVIWCGDNVSGLWWRIFIDGAYCGIDEYPTCEINGDLDESVTQVNHSQRIGEGLIQFALVSNPNLRNRLIVFKMKFKDQHFELVCKSEEGICVLKFNV